MSMPGDDQDEREIVYLCCIKQKETVLLLALIIIACHTINALAIRGVLLSILWTLAETTPHDPVQLQTAQPSTYSCLGVVCVGVSYFHAHLEQ